jgi:hypothetical protein
LISILVLDKRLTGLQRSFLFVLFIAYLFSFLFTYGQIAISDVMVLVFLEGIVIGLFSFETIPHIAALREVHDLSRALSFFLVALITLIMPLVGYGRFSEPIIILLEAINGCLLFFMYRR